MMYEHRLKKDQSPGHEGEVSQLLEMKMDALTLKQKPDKSLFCQKPKCVNAIRMNEFHSLL
jgi:hypothetical protein